MEYTKPQIESRREVVAELTGSASGVTTSLGDSSPDGIMGFAIPAWGRWGR